MKKSILFLVCALLGTGSALTTAATSVTNVNAQSVTEGENVMTIALRSGNEAEVSRWLLRKGVEFPVINDANGAISHSWAISVTPTLVVMSKGRVVSTTSGWTSYWGMKLRLWWAKIF